MKTQKTIKKEILQKRINKLSERGFAKKLIKNFTDNKFPFGEIEADGTIRTCHISGSKKFSKNLDYTSDFRIILNKLGLLYEFGNDAPKGGLTGNYFKILTKIR